MVSLSNHEVAAPSCPNHRVTLGLDPRTLHLPDLQKMKHPRVKPEGDDVWW